MATTRPNSLRKLELNFDDLARAQEDLPAFLSSLPVDARMNLAHQLLDEGVLDGWSALALVIYGVIHVD
jgi:hypothetical protein